MEVFTPDSSFERIDRDFKTRDHPITVALDESVRLKLYGLSKQTTEGTCRMPIPPSSNVILRSKWEAWTACSGLARDQAQSDFMKLAQTAGYAVNDATKKPTVKASTVKESKKSSVTSTLSLSSAASAVSTPFKTPGKRGSTLLPGAVAKSGTLFKQRDIMKGWRPRYFILQGSMLHYYLEVEDPRPKGSMDLSGCSVVAQDSVIVDGDHYFPFVITNTAVKTANPYVLSSSSEKESADWIKLLNAATVLAPASSVVAKEPSPASPSNVTANPPATKKSPAAHEDNIACPNETLENIAPLFMPLVQEQVDRVLTLASPNSQGWEPLFEKSGLNAYRRNDEDGLSILGDYTLTGKQYNILDIFRLITDLQQSAELDATREKSQKKIEFSANTWIEHIVFKEIWPISARDTILLVHWRQLKDGSVVIATSSFADKGIENAVDVPVGKNVRADIMGGYLIKRTGNDSIRLRYVVRMDLKGSIPTSIVNYTATTTPMTLLRIKKLLDEKHTGEVTGDIQSCSYKQLRAAVVMGKITSMKDAQERFSAAATSSGIRASTTAAVAADKDPQQGGGVGQWRNSSSSSSNGSHGHSKTDTNKGPPGTLDSAGSAVVDSPSLPPPGVQTSKLNKIAHSILLLPFLLAYLVTDSWLQIIAFFLGLAVALRYLARLYLAERYFDTATNNSLGTNLTGGGGPGGVGRGKILIKFPVDLELILKYLDKKRESSELEITLTHVTLKAVACAIKAVASSSSGNTTSYGVNDGPSGQSFNGNVFGGRFYRSRKSGVDVGVSFDLTSSVPLAYGGIAPQGFVLKIEDADKKKIEEITNEVLSRGKKMRKRQLELTSHDNNRSSNAQKESPTEEGVLGVYQNFLRALPPFLAHEVDVRVCAFVRSWGVTISSLMIDGAPHGSCLIVNSPNIDGEMDIDVAVLPESEGGTFDGGGYVSTAPLMVTFGGIGVQSYLEDTNDKGKKLQGSPVLQYSVVVDTRAGGLTAARRLCSKLQQFLGDPSLMDNAKS